MTHRFYTDLPYSELDPISTEARKIVADNIAADESSPWQGYQTAMEKLLMIRTGCDPSAAYYAIQEASQPYTLTLGQVARRIIDLEDSLRDMLTLALERIGPDAEKIETYLRARKTLTQKVGAQ